MNEIIIDAKTRYAIRSICAKLDAIHDRTVDIALSLDNRHILCDSIHIATVRDNLLSLIGEHYHGL